MESFQKEEKEELSTLLRKYADLLINYCVEARPGDKILIESTFLAEPLLRELWRSGLEAGAILEFSLDFRDKQRLFYQHAGESQLSYVPLLKRHAFEAFDGYIFVRAPYDFDESHKDFPYKCRLRQEAMQPIRRTYFKRTATRELKRNLCQFPTEIAAQRAGMDLPAYREFIFKACKLYDEDPVRSWLEVRRVQQTIVDRLNAATHIRFVGERTDISFSTKGRIWINSDGQTNMPSGEVYTSPVEDSVNGHIYFKYATDGGEEITDINLEVKDGWITSWNASSNRAHLDKIFAIDGARRFGEAAVGTNYDIQQFTKNILFDEKIGGTIHMAVGQSYLQTGGQNQSAVHWDLIKDMKNGGRIYADGLLIYENGQFL